MRIIEKGNLNETGTNPGDLIIKINVKSDPYFIRDNYDVIVPYYLTISQAVLGSKINVKTLDGNSAEINVKPGTQHGEKHIMRGMGINKLPPN